MRRRGNWTFRIEFLGGDDLAAIMGGGLDLDTRIHVVRKYSGRLIAQRRI